MALEGEVERFLAAFEALREAVGDDPAQLEARWQGDRPLQSLCDELDCAARVFRIVEEGSGVAFTLGTSPAWIAARRDYEARWQRIVDEVAARDILFLLMEIMSKVGHDLADSPDPAERRDELAENIRTWRDEAGEQADSIELMVEHAFTARDFDGLGDFDWVDSSLQAWDRLTKVVRLDIAGALWRRRAIPHILIPAHVSERYGPSNISLYRRLHEAERAFIFGAPLAALALQRAVLEEVLTRHWGSDRGSVATANLPELSWESRASRLKRLANDALHNDADKLVGDALDRAVIENFMLLRLIIERAPQDRGI